jgi:thioredoxin 1
MLKILDFYADWCGPCKMMDPILEELTKELAGKMVIEKINVDEKTDIASQFGVMSIPTYVFMRDDKEVNRVIGYQPKVEFKKKIDEYLG